MMAVFHEYKTQRSESFMLLFSFSLHLSMVNKMTMAKRNPIEQEDGDKRYKSPEIQPMSTRGTPARLLTHHLQAKLRRTCTVYYKKDSLEVTDTNKGSGPKPVPASCMRAS